MFAGLLYAHNTYLEQAEELLTAEFGQISIESDETLWDHSVYYANELGSPIKRRFVFFDNLISTGLIAETKLKTIAIEKALSIDGSRKINIDPGYLTLAKVVLPTTKNRAHRIYLKNGIYAETTLIYLRDNFKPYLFTYTDFTKCETLKLLNKVRKLFKDKLLGK
ncbi:MAG: DUF4416 family protein [Nitrospirae bacterium]|nr:DUF4416 family protein [Nitrospirota bacterium]MBF0533926.1 DUF4416 family protein [Nitrospirota bacterium]MBF0618036.1 DUF4416 family protein [Nitrospirota bacterium]